MTEISDKDLMRKMMMGLATLRKSAWKQRRKDFPEGRMPMGMPGFGGRRGWAPMGGNFPMENGPMGAMGKMNKKAMGEWAQSMGMNPRFAAMAEGGRGYGKRDRHAGMHHHGSFHHSSYSRRGKMERRGWARPGLIRENLLTIIAKNPDGIRAKQVAEKAGINQSSVSESLSKLEGDGYIKRTVDPDDKRATLIFLTELGQARANEIEDQQKEAFDHLFDCLTDEEKQEFARILDKIIAAAAEE